MNKNAKEEKNILDALTFPRKKGASLKDFFDLDIRVYERMLQEKGEKFWQKAGEKKALNLFHETAERVPAYKHFLKQHKIQHKKIKSVSDFHKVPITTKENYIEVYPLEQRSWDGYIHTSNLVASSSGTSGEPKYWPRSGAQEFEAAILHEFLLRSLFDIEKHKTLLVVGFPMGVYVSGMATTLPSWLVSEKGYDLTLLTPGLNKDSILKSLRSLQGHYDQIVLIGHPFFIKDTIESASEYGVDWSKNIVKIMLCSEGFKEVWREYVLNQIKEDEHNFRIFNTYGSSELLLMGSETPMSILVKHIAEQNEKFAQDLFQRNTVPNFFQYNPLLRYIESVDNNLLFTVGSGVPLIRFALEDRGSVHTFDEVKQFLDTVDNKWDKKMHDVDKRKVWQMPFVSLWGRTDQTVTFHGINIFPDYVRRALDRKSLLRSTTGKFTLRNGYKKNMDQFLEINVELKPKLKSSSFLMKEIQKAVVLELLAESIEYRFLSQSVSKDLRPSVKLWCTGHPKYFKTGQKPRYIFRP